MNRNQGVQFAPEYPFISADEVLNITDRLRAYWLEFGKLPQIERPLFLRELSFDEKLKRPSFKKAIDELEKKY